MDRLLETCPFNALHRFLGSEREKHLSECVDRYKVLTQRYENEMKGNVSVPLYTRKGEHVKNQDEEDWDLDL